MAPLKLKLARPNGLGAPPRPAPAAAPLSIDARLFDAAYYREQNPDVAGSGADPLDHFLAQGWREGRNPNPWFSIHYYHLTNPDVHTFGINPLAHYAGFGWREGRDPSASFSIAKYLNTYHDVRDAGIDPLLHYILFGRVDGRTAFHV